MINKTSVRFLWQFVLIIGMSFAVIFAVGYFTTADESTHAEIAAPTEE